MQNECNQSSRTSRPTTPISSEPGLLCLIKPTALKIPCTKCKRITIGYKLPHLRYRRRKNKLSARCGQVQAHGKPVASNHINEFASSTVADQLAPRPRQANSDALRLKQSMAGRPAWQGPRDEKSSMSCKHWRRMAKPLVSSPPPAPEALKRHCTSSFVSHCRLKRSSLVPPYRTDRQSMPSRSKVHDLFINPVTGDTVYRLQRVGQWVLKIS